MIAAVEVKARITADAALESILPIGVNSLKQQRPIFL
jgi:hypothetical protein